MSSSQTPCFDLYFVGASNDPRHVQIIGFEDSDPVLYAFQTISYGSQTRTSVTKGSGDAVAYFDWTSNSHLGLCVVGPSRKFAMTYLVEAGSTSFSRQFVHLGSKFEWRRISNDTYDLYSSDGVRLALFRSKPQQTPVGEAYGYMQYAFKGRDSLLVDTLLALCLNRWIDRHGL